MTAWPASNAISCASGWRFTSPPTPRSFGHVFDAVPAEPRHFSTMDLRGEAGPRRHALLMDDDLPHGPGAGDELLDLRGKHRRHHALSPHYRPVAPRGSVGQQAGELRQLYPGGLRPEEIVRAL